MQRDYRQITLFDAVTPVAVTSSTDATPIVMTVTAHGYVTGDRVLIIGHTTNIAANGVFKVTVLSSSTFSLQDEFTGANIAGTGSGSGSSGLTVKAPPILMVKDYRNIIIQFGTSGTATTTLKVAGSLGKPDNATNTIAARKDMPNFAGTVSPSNYYGFLQVIDLDTAAAVNGATGLVATGADVLKLYEVNVNAMTYLTVFPVTWSAGAITVMALVANNI
jgi:hypothetical protein